MLNIGIDVGGTNIEVGLIDEKGNIIGELISHTKSEKSFEEIDENLILLTEQLIKEQRINIRDIMSIGIGLPGVTDSERGVFVTAPNLKVDGFPIKDVFEKKFGIPVFIDNDANCAALAEAVLGSMKDFDYSVTITLGTGIGSGIIMNKRIFQWPHDFAGEIGHMVIQLDGELCGCGRKGCWEQYASSSALRRMAVKELEKNSDSLIIKMVDGNLEKISTRIVFEADKRGDRIAREVIDIYIKYLGEGLVNVINILAPQAIAIGGGISRQGDRIIKPVKEMVNSKIFARSMIIPEILPAEFARQAGIIGASMLGRQNG